MALTKVLHTTSASSRGGRNGHTKNKDGLVSVDLSVPKDMGGPGKPNTTRPRTSSRRDIRRAWAARSTTWPRR